MADQTDQDGNAIVVTGATAARYRLRTISDLARVAPGLCSAVRPNAPSARAACPVFGRPTGCGSARSPRLRPGGR